MHNVLNISAVSFVHKFLGIPDSKQDLSHFCFIWRGVSFLVPRNMHVYPITAHILQKQNCCVRLHIVPMFPKAFTSVLFLVIYHAFLRLKNKYNKISKKQSPCISDFWCNFTCSLGPSSEAQIFMRDYKTYTIHHRSFLFKYIRFSILSNLGNNFK